jgi:hypothetical protein
MCGAPVVAQKTRIQSMLRRIRVLRHGNVEAPQAQIRGSYLNE